MDGITHARVNNTLFFFWGGGGVIMGRFPHSILALTHHWCSVLVGAFSYSTYMELSIQYCLNVDLMLDQLFDTLT